MPNARYAAGDQVVFLPETSDINTTRGLYTIVRVMPANPGGFSYRVKSDNDTHERVIVETQLAPR